ncbi:MAG: hypothetical protein ACR2H5_02010 [Ktedonobacteraceae bacterium]
MCTSCGCGQPNNDQGDQRNITQNDLNNAAQAAGITPKQVAQNIMTSQGQGASQTNTPAQFAGQRIGDAGHITPESPEIVAQDIKTTEAAFSSGTKPADVGQTGSSGQTGTSGTDQ